MHEFERKKTLFSGFQMGVYAFLIWLSGKLALGVLIIEPRQKQV